MAEFVRGFAHAHEQVGPADVADEQGVPGQDAIGSGVRLVGPHDDRDRLRCVAGRVAHLEHHRAERQALAVCEQASGELRLGDTTEAHIGPCRLREFQVTGQEVGVEVRLEDVGDRESVTARGVEVLLDVALRVDDGGLSR